MPVESMHRSTCEGNENNGATRSTLANLKKREHKEN